MYRGWSAQAAGLNMAALCVGTTVMTHSDTFFKVDVGSCRDAIIANIDLCTSGKAVYN